MVNNKQRKTLAFNPFPRTKPAGPRLTPLEKKIATLILVHFCMKKVARDLDLSPSTVRSYARNLRLKMGVDKSIGAAYRARDLGLIKGK